ncbi:MAG: arginase family protein, partial [Pseudomonadota bacterium]
MSKIRLLGAPTQAGTYRRGCLMGPDALRTAGLGDNLESLGHEIVGDETIVPAKVAIDDAPHAPAHHVGEVAGWIRA